MLVLVCGEIHLRRERGEQPSLTEYQERFAALGDDLELQFELDRLLDSSSTEPDEAIEGSKLKARRSSWQDTKCWRRSGGALVVLSICVASDRSTGWWRSRH
jgi:hypothetical protein